MTEFALQSLQITDDKAKRKVREEAIMASSTCSGLAVFWMLCMNLRGRWLKDGS